MVVSPFPRFLLSIVLALCSVADLIAARRGAALYVVMRPTRVCAAFPFLSSLCGDRGLWRRPFPQGFTKTKSNKIASLATRFRIKERNCVRLYDLNDTKDSEKPKLQREGKGQAEANERETRNERRETSDPAHEALRLLNLPLPFVCCAGEGGKVVVF